MEDPTNGDRLHTVVTGEVDTTFTWNYVPRNVRTANLYAKAKNGQWDTSDVDWSVEVERGPSAIERTVWGGAMPPGFPLAVESYAAFAWEYHVWLVSQFLHGEQGALLAAARLVEVLPDIEGKMLAASQVIDEARHVEVYARYLDQKVGESYPVSSALEELLRQIVSDRRWDLCSLGMQIIIEGLALASFRLSQGVGDGLLNDITDRIARDEARHVSFGMLQLDGMYRELTSAERRDRENFVLEAAYLMASRFELPEVWDRLEVDVAAGQAFLRNDASMVAFRQVLFSRVNAAIARLDLMTDHVRDGLIQLRLYRPVLGGRA